eukprot:gene30612-37855_t
MKLDTSPIAAIATAPGRGGIGVVRASGKNLKGLIEALFGAATLQPRHATYIPFKQADGTVIDQGIAIHFKGPNSYTGEDVLELQGHGGPVVLQMLLARVLEAGQALGLRLAEPGEFTRRAYLNDKLDLAQAEAVADLIDASTEAAAKSASQSLSGAFSKTIHALVERVTNLRMLVEATLDFPEEEIDFLEKSDARGQLSGIVEALETVFRQAAQGALLREGLNVVLVGQPNVGKSSLLNALAGSDVAIVTPIAGTTRDKVSETIQIEGIPLNIIDTAGIRRKDEDVDVVERIGIERTWGEVEKADVILHLLDADHGPSRADESIVANFPAGVPRPKVVEIVHWAASNGDRSENGDYLYGKKRLREIDRRIRFLTKRLEMAEVVDPSVHHGSDQVFFGATVTYLESSGVERTVTIMGIDEADSLKGQVSWVSPIARTLIKSPGDAIWRDGH